MNREHPVTIGNRTEARVLASLLETYEVVLLPFGGNCRYDMAFETTEGLKKVQCKTGRYRKGAVIFSTCSSTLHRSTGTVRAYYGDADFFGVYCPELKTVYLVPVDICPSRDASLRVDPSKNNQTTLVRLASDYILLPGKDSNLD